MSDSEDQKHDKKVEELRISDAIEYMTEDAKGRYFLRFILKAGHFGEDLFSEQPFVHARNAGVQSLANKIARMVSHHQPARFNVVLNEMNAMTTGEQPQ